MVYALHSRQVFKTVITHLRLLPREVFETETRKLKFDGISFSFSGDHTGGFSKVFENGFRFRLVFVCLPRYKKIKKFRPFTPINHAHGHRF